MQEWASLGQDLVKRRRSGGPSRPRAARGGSRPMPGPELSAHALPPIASASARAMARPIPTRRPHGSGQDRPGRSARTRPRAGRVQDLGPDPDGDPHVTGRDDRDDRDRRPVGRMAERIRHVVGEDLGDPIAVAEDASGRDGDDARTLRGMPPAERSARRHRDDHRHIDGVGLEHELVSLGAPEFGEVGDEPAEPVGLGAEHLPGLRCRADDAILESLEIPVERREGRPELDARRHRRAGPAAVRWTRATPPSRRRRWRAGGAPPGSSTGTRSA